MRLTRFVIAASLLLCALPAHATLLWSETSEAGTPVLYWSKGANIGEVHAAARATIGRPYTVVLSCRKAGYFAYVGSPGQTMRGVSCGYETAEGALYEARNNCEAEGGRCDLEKVGYDSGKPIAGNASDTGIPAALPGLTPSDDTPVTVGVTELNN